MKSDHESPSKITFLPSDEFYTNINRSLTNNSTMTSSIAPILQSRINFLITQQNPKIVWQALKYFSIFLPCIGHVGIQNSQGVIYDFRSNQLVGIDLFGEVAQEVLIDCENYEIFDECLLQIQNFYQNPQLKISEYNFYKNNCHHYISNALNIINQNTSKRLNPKQYSMFSIFWMVLIKGMLWLHEIVWTSYGHYSPLFNDSSSNIDNLQYFISKMLSNFLRFRFSGVTIYKGNQCRSLLKVGTSAVCKAAVTTLGPFVNESKYRKGRNVVIDYEAGGGPKITKDGVTVAKNVIFEDRLVDIGAAIIRKSAGLTNDRAGDGTTTSILLASEIFRLGQSLVESGSNPNFIIRGVKLGLTHVLDLLQDMRVFDNSEKNLRNIALISSNYDQQQSSIIFDAINLMGEDGKINIESGSSRQTYLEVTIGAQLTRGYVNENLVMKGSTYSELQSPLVLVSKQNIDKIRDIVPFLEYAQQQLQPLFIIAPDISDEVISCLVFNQQKGILNTCAITIPGFGNHSSDIINDINILVGGQSIDQFSIKQDKKYEDVYFLGGASRIKISASETYIFGPKGDEVTIDSHKQLLKQLLNSTSNVTGQALLQERLTRLSGKSVTIYVGGNTQVEIDENRDIIIDCLNATQNALKEGILPGGGSALAHSSKILDTIQLDNDEEQNGINLLKSFKYILKLETLRQPLNQLMKSADINPSQAERIIQETQNFNIGFDLKTGQMGDMIELGVVDSYLVTQQALISGVNLGCLLLSCEVAIIQNLKYSETKLSHYKKDIF